MALHALIFDFDGLILDTEVSEFTTVREAFADHGLELTLQAWQRRVGRADHAHWLDELEELYGRPLPDRDGVRQKRMQRHHAMIELEVIRPGVVELLAEAASLGVPAAVASSSSRGWVEGHLDRLGVLDRFLAVVTRDDVERAKPWPDLFLEACRRVGANPERSVAFEDSHNGSLAAKRAGLYCVVVPNDITRDHDFSHADLIMTTLADVSIADLLARR